MDETVDMTSDSATPLNEEGTQIPENPTPQSEPEVQDVPNSNKRPNEEDAPSKGKKKKRSWLWEHFEKFNKNGVERSKCLYCKIDVSGSSRLGTTPMKNHLQICKEYPPNIDKSQRRLSLQSEQTTRDDSVGENVVGEKKGKLELWKFKQDDGRKAFARMIIMDELPFRFSEREGFRYFMSVVQPNFLIPSRITVARDCYRVYVDEKKNLKFFFSKCSSRICLTTDTWTSCQNLSYMCLTAHFIDQNWKLHKKILNFCPISGHSGEVIGKEVEKRLLEWGITRVLTITVDNASSNDVGLQYLKRRFQRWKDGTVLNGRFVHMRCAAHILNLTVKEGLKETDNSIKRIRNGVRFVRSSPARMQKFKNCVNQEQIESKRQLCLDVDTRWNTTYLMLDYALIYRKAFDLLETCDGGKFRTELSKTCGVPEDEDWDRVASLIPFLKIFYDATLRLSGSLFVTSNMYLQELVTINRMIKRRCDSHDHNEKMMAYGMKAKHDKYWENIDNINLMLYIAVVLDARRKLDYVKWAIDDQYDSDKARELYGRIKETLTSLYEHYATQQSENQSTTSELDDLSSQDLENYDEHDMAVYEFERDVGAQSVVQKKSDLDKYLEDEREPHVIGKNFNALEWWKKREESYPVVSLMARDVLAIPVSTVASESAFSTGGRVLDPFRSSLSPTMVEALICAQDWLRMTNEPLVVEERIEDLEKIEEELSTLVEQVSVVDDYI